MKKKNNKPKNFDCLQGIFLWTLFIIIFIYLLRSRGRRTVPKLFAPPILKIKVWPIAIHGWHFGVGVAVAYCSLYFVFFFTILLCICEGLLGICRIRVGKWWCGIKCCVVCMVGRGKNRSDVIILQFVVYGLV